LINIVFSYDPVGYLPYNYLLFTDTREPLVEVAAQLLCITLENTSIEQTNGEDCPNLFLNYLSRIHRDEVQPMNFCFCSQFPFFFHLGF